MELELIVLSDLKLMLCYFIFFFQAEDGIRDYKVTGVQTCALPISAATASSTPASRRAMTVTRKMATGARQAAKPRVRRPSSPRPATVTESLRRRREIGRASCRERG